ncbi:MAG: signal peptidase II [Calditrichaeota bacterium]|nr:MAG: signal peptidase II [Calditrichota bacterium]
MTSRRYVVITLVIFVSIIIDHITKFFAKQYLRNSPPQIYFNDFFRFQYAENTGAMLGLGSTLPETTRFWIFTVAVGILLLALLIYLYRGMGHLTSLQSLGLSLIAGGGLSNFVDRLINKGRVVDFMNMGIGDTLRTGIFNVADMLIMLGMAIVLVFGIGKPHKKQNEHLTNESHPTGGMYGKD